MLTLSEAETQLKRFVGNGLDFVTQLNVATERMVKSGNWRGTKAQVLFNAFPDSNNACHITLPREFNTILAIAPLPEGNKSSAAMPIRNEWYEFYAGGPGFITDQTVSWDRGIVPVAGRFTTFADFSNCKLKVVTEQTELGSLYLKGSGGGSRIYTFSEGNWQDGVKLSLTSGSTTSQTFDSAPFSVIKPVTNGRIWLYAVAADLTETLVAIYQPTETGIAWPRYKFPTHKEATSAAPDQYVAICKRAWIPVSAPTDEVIPGNLGALTYALKALAKEDAEDYARANALWNGDKRTKTIGAMQLLAQEVEDDTGAGSEGVIQFDDTFNIGAISYGV